MRLNHRDGMHAGIDEKSLPTKRTLHLHLRPRGRQGEHLMTKRALELECHGELTEFRLEF